MKLFNEFKIALLDVFSCLLDLIYCLIMRLSMSIFYRGLVIGCVIVFGLMILICD